MAHQTTIRIPTPLRRYTDNAATVDVEAETVAGALKLLVELHPELRTHLYKEDGSLRSFVNVYRGDEDIRYLDGPATSIEEETELSIVPSVAGG